MKQSPGWEVVLSWGHSSWLSSHRIAEESSQEGRGFEDSPWASFPEPGGFPHSPRGISRVSCFLQLCWPSSDATAEATSTPFPEEPWLRGSRGRERPTGPTPLQPLPEEPSRWKCQLDWQAAAVQGGSGRDLSFPLRARRHVNPGGWLLTSPQSSVPSPRAPMLGQCLLLNETGGSFWPHSATQAWWDDLNRFHWAAPDRGQ